MKVIHQDKTYNVDYVIVKYSTFVVIYDPKVNKSYYISEADSGVIIGWREGDWLIIDNHYIIREDRKKSWKLEKSTYHYQLRLIEDVIEFNG